MCLKWWIIFQFKLFEIKYLWYSHIFKLLTIELISGKRYICFNDNINHIDQNIIQLEVESTLVHTITRHRYTIWCSEFIMTYETKVHRLEILKISHVLLQEKLELTLAKNRHKEKKIDD